MLLPRSGEFLTGSDSSQRLRRVFPSAVKPVDLMALLYGQPPGATPDAKSLKGSVDGNRFRLEVYARGQWVQTLWVDPATGMLVKAEIADGKGKTAYKVLFYNFTKTGSLSLPGRIEIETEGLERIHLSLRNTDMELTSRDDDPDFFLLKPPPGIDPAAAGIKKALGLTAGALWSVSSISSISSVSSCLLNPTYPSFIKRASCTLFSSPVPWSLIPGPLL